MMPVSSQEIFADKLHDLLVTNTLTRNSQGDTWDGYLGCLRSSDKKYGEQLNRSSFCTFPSFEHVMKEASLREESFDACTNETF